ncbi:hypothetical protein OB2597_13338 [Pseudooceanicola batsensis HTCC2597]|uniref:Caspase family p20 domain-containing protein n=1 Tax=Pseudooceanicola batsensis (strain ATCC BAA-863 / DSM 15984 / KCTC 12145 / HTCC2597) TaxID=252305 RepID=A3TY96_PSEBH|nr:hypothetical protein OB2597_13338 [Pseudooceanicola batsensis HTCC2597]
MYRLIVACLVWCLSGTLALAESRLAFVVGNSAYRSVSALENPINDALDISVALEGLGFDVILGSDTSMEEMRTGIRHFAERAETADVVLFYYAGHGFQVSGQNYLVPVDAELTSIADLQDQTVPVTDIMTAMQKSRGIKLVFLDACRDNPFGVGMETLPGVDTGLARVGTAADFMFVYATQPDNVAYDGTGRNSFFTEAVLNHIYTPGQDLAELMVSVRRDVLAATGGRQVPWENSSLTRLFEFDQSPETVSEETMLWQVAASEKDPGLMQLYMERYPQGTHAEDVLAFLDTGTRTRTLGLKDEEAEASRLWHLARRSRMRPLLEYYVETYPDGANAAEARRLLSLIPRAEDSTPGGICERLATHPRDATAANSGVPFSRLRENALTAIQACSAAAAQSPELPHYTALLARATAASGDFDRAIQLYKSASDRGDLRAMVSLAQLYESGTGVPLDPATAQSLYERAAEGGSPDAMINLAVSLFTGAQGTTDAERGVASCAARRVGWPRGVQPRRAGTGRRDRHAGGRAGVFRTGRKGRRTRGLSRLGHPARRGSRRPARPRARGEPPSSGRRGGPGDADQAPDGSDQRMVARHAHGGATAPQDRGVLRQRGGRPARSELHLGPDPLAERWLQRRRARELRQAGAPS